MMLVLRSDRKSAEALKRQEGRCMSKEVRMEVHA